MNNSKTNKGKKMRFEPNGWKRSRFLCGNEKINSSVFEKYMALSDFWYRMMQNNKRYNKDQIQQVMIVDFYVHENRDGKGQLTSSALHKMMKVFEATGSLKSLIRCGPVATS